MSPYDSFRPVRLLRYGPDGTHEFQVTQGFLEQKMKDWYKKNQQIYCNTGKPPRVCIAGYMDFLWLHAYVADYIGAQKVPLVFEQDHIPVGDDFPKHFTYRGILIIEALEVETGYTFA